MLTVATRIRVFVYRRRSRRLREFNEEVQKFEEYDDMFDQYVLAHEIPVAHGKALFLSSFGTMTCATTQHGIIGKTSDKTLEEHRKVLFAISHPSSGK